MKEAPLHPINADALFQNVKYLEDSVLPKMGEFDKAGFGDTFDEMYELIDRFIPKKPLGTHYQVMKCPKCNKRVRSGLGSSYNAQPKFCDKCGQALDWSEANKKWDRWHIHS